MSDAKLRSFMEQKGDEIINALGDGTAVFIAHEHDKDGSKVGLVQKCRMVDPGTLMETITHIFENLDNDDKLDLLKILARGMRTEIENDILKPGLNGISSKDPFMFLPKNPTDEDAVEFLDKAVDAMLREQGSSKSNMLNSLS